MTVSEHIETLSRDIVAQLRLILGNLRSAGMDLETDISEQERSIIQERLEEQIDRELAHQLNKRLMESDTPADQIEEAIDEL